MAQSAASRIVAVVTPASEAAEVAALLTECALKMLVSMLALLRIVFNQRASVDEETGLCGLIIATATACWCSQNVCLWFFSHIPEVPTLDRASCFAQTLERKTLSLALSGEIASPVLKDRRSRPSGLNCLKRMSRFVRSIDLGGLVKASRVTTLRVRSGKLRSLFSPKDSMWFVTFATSQVVEYRG